MFPKRGAAAVLLTAIALVALLLYRTPEIGPGADPSAYMDVAAAGQSAPGSIAGSPWPSGWFGSPEPENAASGQPSISPSGGAQPGQPSGQPGGPAATPSPTLAPGATPTTPPAPTHAPTPGTNPTNPPAPTPAGFTGTVVGATSSTKYGPVQVEAVYSGGRITNVIAMQLPSGDSKSISIAQHAAPILRSEALTAQSAQINTVSGATYTSDGYKASLQSAIDKA